MTPRFISRHGVRHVEALDKADALAEAVDREMVRTLRRLIQVVRSGSVYSVAHQRAGAILHSLPYVLADLLDERLRRLARWGYSTAARLLLQLPRRYLRAAIVIEARNGRNWTELDGIGRLLEREPGGALDQEDEFQYFLDLLFPPPEEAFLHSVIHASGWTGRIESLSRLNAPALLAGIVAGGMVQGKTQQEIARDLMPALDNVRASARRVARTEGIRVLHSMQRASWDKLGDMVVGFQVHATLDDRTRSWHAARNGQVYYKEPEEGQKGLEQMPNPPEEPADPRERPAGEPQVAPN